MPEVFSLGSWSVGESFSSPLRDSPSRLRRSILSSPTRKNPWHPGYSPLNDGLEGAQCSVPPSQTLSLHIPVSGRSYVIRLFFCLRSLVSCKRAAHLTSFLRKTSTIITEIQNAGFQTKDAIELKICQQP